MIKPQTLKGFRDFLPEESRKRQYVIEKFKSVFESFGFEPLETPSLEYEEILIGKYGDEGDKLMYRFEDNGKRRVAMRYDQTVPLARVAAQYQNDLPVPFKRYQIQSVWRAENTQKGRYREFVQCDIDTIGLHTPVTDAEIIATAAKALSALGFNKNFSILVNDRRVFSALIESGKITKTEMVYAVIAIDKIKKIGENGVIDELVTKDISIERAKEILSLIANQEKTDSLKDIATILEDQPFLQGKITFDPTLVRGLSYYTGLIFEIEAEGFNAGSICGGGRYDNLIGMFSGNQIPAVGCSFGFDRIIEAMEQLNLFPPSLAQSVTKVLVTIFSDDFKKRSQVLADTLRNNNINAEIYLGEIKEKNPLEKQLKYADQKKIPYAIILGPEEIKENNMTLKNLQNRDQNKKSFDEVLEELRK